MIDLSIVIPAYKEEENLTYLLPKIINEVNALNIASEILIIDTNKPLDNTKKICEKYGVIYLNRDFDNNYGSALKKGIMQSKGEKTLVMDSDGSHDPKEIKNLYSYSKKYDLVIGSRYVKNGNTENNRLLIFLSYLVNIFYRVFLKINVKDISNSFRVYDSNQLKSLNINCKHFDVVEEILIKILIKYPHISLIEVPITFKKRVSGKSKRKLLAFSFSYISTLIKLLKIKKAYKIKLNISNQ
jgi:dolichol-phosphate mannosyltransferase